MKYEWFDTSELCNTFNVDGACSMLVDTTPCKTYNFIGGMTGRKHSEETKNKMRESAPKSKPHLHKGGSLMSPEGEVVHFSCRAHFCKEQGWTRGKLTELLNGKRKSHKGWTKYE